MVPVEQHSPTDLRAVLSLLHRQRWTIALTTIVITIAALASALVATPVYATSVQLVIEPSGLAAETALSSPTLVEQEIETQLAIVTSEQVAARAATELGIAMSPQALQGQVAAAQIGSTRAIVISARDLDPDRAAAIAQAFAEAYLADRREQALERALEATADLRSRTAQIRERVGELESQIAATAEPSDALVEERNSLLEQLGHLSAQLTTLEASGDLTRGGGEIIRDAPVPRRPVEPQPAQRTILGFLLGLTLGLGLAWLRDRLDDSVKDDAGAIDALGGRPLLGSVPTITDEEAPYPILMSPSSPSAEAFRTLHTNVRLSSVRESFRSVLVTSAQPSEGKSTVAVNLAIAAARAGRRVVLVDADLRRGSTHVRLNLPSGEGLSEVLVGELHWTDALRDVGIPNLQVMSSGTPPPNPAELLGHEFASEILEALAETADVTIIDGPPVLPVADALELASRAAATLVVVDRAQSSRRHVRKTVQRLEHATARIVGGVLNHAQTDDGYGYYSYYARATTVDAEA